MADSKFVELVTAAHQYLTARQDGLTAAFGLSSYQRWDWDADRRRIVFSDGSVPRVIAQTQLVGSVSHKTGTWLWSWANESIGPELRENIPEVRRFGEHHGIWQLTTAKWEAEEGDGWEMTSIAAYVLQAKGAYRMPSQDLLTFAIFESVAWAPTAATEQMRGLLGFVGASVGSALGWWAGAHVGLMTAALVSAVGTGIGLWLALRLAADYLP